MAIEISKTSSAPLPLQEGKSRADATPRDSTAPSNPGANRGGSDSVSLTSAAAHLQRLGSEAAALPVVDAQRVEHVQQAMNDGSYTFDAAGVAAKLVQFERQLNGGS